VAHTEPGDLAWQALEQRCIAPGRGKRLVVKETNRRAHVWPLSQVVGAAMARSVVTESDWHVTAGLFRGIADYKRGASYTDGPRWSPGLRYVYYDDNAWLGLAYVQSALLRIKEARPGSPDFDLRAARQILDFLRRGEDRARGGIRWRERGETRNACSTAPTGLVALRVVEAERAAGIKADDHVELIALAQRCTKFLESIRDDRGLICDLQNNDGRIDPSIFSYNQGTTIGLYLQLARVADDDAALATAKSTAKIVTEHYSQDDRLWGECPSFLAILARHLLCLGDFDGDGRWPPLFDEWLTRAEEQGRNPSTGFYSEGGIGHYDGSICLDQGGVVQMHYMPQWDRELVQFLC